LGFRTLASSDKTWLNQNDSKNSFCKTHQEEWAEGFARKKGALIL